MAGDSKKEKETKKGDSKDKATAKDGKDAEEKKMDEQKSRDEDKENIEQQENRGEEDREEQVSGDEGKEERKSGDENKENVEGADEQREGSKKEDEADSGVTVDLENQEVVENAKKEIIQEFIAPMEKEESNVESEINQQIPDQPIRKFKKKRMMRKRTFSIANLDEYLHYKYRKVDRNLRLLVEVLIVCFLFMLFPTILIIWRRPRDYNIFKTLNHAGKTNAVLEFFRQNLFLSLTYVIFTASTVLMDYSLQMIASVLSSFDVKVEGYVADFLEVLKLYSHYLRNFLAFSLVFLLSNVLIMRYRFGRKSFTTTYLSVTFIFWFSCLSAVLFFEKLLVNILTSEMKKSSFRNRIWDANYKTYVFKKLAAIAEAVPRGQYEVQLAMHSVQNDYDTGYFLRHNDLDITTEDKAEGVAESIFAYLDIDTLDYDQITTYFQNRPEEVIQYLGNTNKPPEEISIDFEKLRQRAVELCRERNDIKRSLFDRDSIIRKLDLILLGGVLFASALGFLFLINVDYKFYLTSVGPFLFAFSWIFQDSIKDLYKCFVFHLISHPYDVGDRVIIDDQENIVVRIDLLYTTFTNNNNRLAYIPNTSLFGKKIDNVRRSRNQYEQLTVYVDQNVRYKTLDDLKHKLEDLCKEKETVFTGHAYIREVSKAEDKLQVTLALEHNSNFQDINEKYKRRKESIDVVEQALSETGIRYDEYYQFAE